MELYGIVFSVYKLNVLSSCMEPSMASYAIVQKKGGVCYFVDFVIRG